MTIPDTRNGLNAMACVSALQKCIRRGMEREAMEFAVELMHTSKAFHTMVCKRLEIISHEDVDTQANPMIVPFVAAAVAQAMKWYDRGTKPGKSRMAIGNAIRLMCRARRAVKAITSLRRLVARSSKASSRSSPIGRRRHTIEGKKLGRGMEDFREEGAKLHPPPTGDDPYIEEAYRLWELKAKQPKATGELF